MINDLEIFNIPECFYNASHTNNIKPCDCDKIYFDVNIDFKPIRVILCKDWYNMIYKNLLNDIPCCVEKIKFRFMITSEHIRECIIKYLIKTYFNCAVFESMSQNYDGWRLNNNDFNMAITLCERPNLVIWINPFKFLNWYLNEGGTRYYSSHSVYRRAINTISEIMQNKAYSCKSLNYKKYDKLRELLRKFKKSAYSYDEQKAAECFNDAFIEYLKYFSN